MRLAPRQPLDTSACGSAGATAGSSSEVVHEEESQVDAQIAHELEAELRNLRTKMADKGPVPPIVRRVQTVKQFLDDSKKAAEEGLGV